MSLELCEWRTQLHLKSLIVNICGGILIAFVKSVSDCMEIVVCYHEVIRITRCKSACNEPNCMLGTLHLPALSISLHNNRSPPVTKQQTSGTKPFRSAVHICLERSPILVLRQGKRFKQRRAENSGLEYDYKVFWQLEKMDLPPFPGEEWKTPSLLHSEGRDTVLDVAPSSCLIRLNAHDSFNWGRKRNPVAETFWYLEYRTMD